VQNFKLFYNRLRITFGFISGLLNPCFRIRRFPRIPHILSLVMFALYGSIIVGGLHCGLECNAMKCKHHLIKDFFPKFFGSMFEWAPGQAHTRTIEKNAEASDGRSSYSQWICHSYYYSNTHIYYYGHCLLHSITLMVCKY
jgi:hypothetical protein